MKINLDSILIGSDFEMFLVKKGTDVVVSAIPFNVGTKANPEKLDREGCCIQRDGVLEECNVPPVRINQEEEFADNVQYVKEYLKNYLKPHNVELLCCPSSEIPQEELQDEEARELGCSPDFNAWTEEVNEKPDATDLTMRSCGGHIHVSYEDANYDTSIELVRLFDLFLGVPFIFIDTDTRRRLLYGKAGCFRMCDWGESQGFEYRVLSNKWIENEELIFYVFNQLRKAIEYYNENGISAIMEDKENIINAINNSDEDMAYTLCEKYNIHLIMEYVL